MILLSALTSIAAADDGWPKEIQTDRGSIVIYQPQVERFEGIDLEARAVALKINAGSGGVPGRVAPRVDGQAGVVGASRRMPSVTWLRPR